MRRRLVLSLITLAGCVERSPTVPPPPPTPPPPAVAPPPAPGLSVRAGQLWLTTETGEEKSGRGLIGTSLELDEYSVRIDDVQTDVRSGRTLLTVKAIARDGTESEYCTPDPDGARLAMALEQTNGQIDLLCSSGAFVKCARWGYPPGTPKSDPIKQQLHDACVRMVRADYGGDGSTHTRDGTVIAFCDLRGVNPCKEDLLPIEAAWAPTGAVCVAKPRVPSLISLKALATKYPQLVTGSSCTRSRLARDERVLLFSHVP